MNPTVTRTAQRSAVSKTLLERSWDRAWKGIGATEPAQSIFDQLVAAYNEPDRKYHTVQHLTECLAAFEAARHLAEHPAAVEVALWFHDAVYDVRGKDNEARSAEWASRALRHAGVSAESLTLVESLVLATRHTAMPVTPDEQVLVDIDLSILGAPEERFQEYESQIRQEYAHVPGFIFRLKRRSILKSFLNRPRIFSTDHFHDLLEDAARQNLRQVVSGKRGS